MRPTLKVCLLLLASLLVTAAAFSASGLMNHESEASTDVVWRPAIVRTLECRTFFVTRTDRCTRTTIIDAVLESPGPYFEDILKVVRFVAEGGAKWEDRQLYDVEIAKPSRSIFGDAKYRIRQRPNKAPEPTPGAVTPRATEGVSK